MTITANLRTMVRIWRGDLGWSAALGAGRIRIDGPEQLRRAVPSWFALSPFAAAYAPATTHHHASFSPGKTGSTMM